MKNLRTSVLLIICVVTHSTHASELTNSDLRSLFANFGELQEGSFGESIAASWEDSATESKVIDKGQKTKKLIKKIRKYPYDYGHNSVGRLLAQRGVEAIPQLLEALEGAGDYYRISLLNILSEISDPRRDAAFVAQLEMLLGEKRNSLWDDIAKPLIRTVFTGNIQRGVPTLKRFLTADDVARGVRAEARIALVRLGELDVSSLLAVSYETASELETEAVHSQMKLLESLLKYELIVAPIRLSEIEVDTKDSVVLRGAIDKGTWYIRFGKEQTGRIPFYYTWYTGFVFSAGYVGVFENVDGQWIVTHWRIAWIS